MTNNMNVVHLDVSAVEELAQTFHYAAREALPVRVAVDFDGFKLSINRSSWSPGVGSTTDPLDRAPVEVNE